jgi:hypothetical protein
LVKCDFQVPSIKGEHLRAPRAIKLVAAR